MPVHTSKRGRRKFWKCLPYSHHGSGDVQCSWISCKPSPQVLMGGVVPGRDATQLGISALTARIKNKSPGHSYLRWLPVGNVYRGQWGSLLVLLDSPPGSLFKFPARSQLNSLVAVIYACKPPAKGIFFSSQTFPFLGFIVVFEVVSAKMNGNGNLPCKSGGECPCSVGQGEADMVENACG